MGQFDKELERWNICFDIFIEEERFDHIDLVFEPEQGNKAQEKKAEEKTQDETPLREIVDKIFRKPLKQKDDKDESKKSHDKEPKIDHDLFFLELLENADYGHFLIGENLYCCSEMCNKAGCKGLYESSLKLWYPLFVAKKARAYLQSVGRDTYLQLLDVIAQFLQSRIGEIYSYFEVELVGERVSKPGDFNLKKFLLLYYNEISQCYGIGRLGVGFADLALKQYSSGKSHYELLSLYNQALGLSHAEDFVNRQKALKKFDQVITGFDFAKPNFGYNYSLNTTLWKKYVYFPALRQKGDLLSKLQRGKESIDVFESLLKKLDGFEIHGSPNNPELDLFYITITSRILLLFSVIEAGVFEKNKLKNPQKYNEKNVKKEIKKIRKELREKYKEKECNLNCKFRALEAKFIIEKYNYRGQGGYIKNRRKEIFRSLSNSKSNFEFFQIRGDKAEQIQAAHTWLEAYKLLLDYEKDSVKPEDKDFLINFLITVAKLVIEIMSDEKQKNNWLPNKDKFLKTLLDVFESSFKNKLLAEKEEELLKQLAEEANSYAKLKFARRISLLGKKTDHNKDHNFNFPKVKQLELIKNFSKHCINRDFYSHKLKVNTETFHKQLLYTSYWPKRKDKYVLTVLRKWQSFTPSLGSYSQNSRGGGYFVYKVGNKGHIEEGIVIDPGYDFVENFLEHGFSVKDVSAIVFTHCHPDHSIDFRGLMTLFHEMNKRGIRELNYWKKRKTTIILSPGCFDHFFPMIDEYKDSIKDVVVLDPHNDRGEGDKNKLKLREEPLNKVAIGEKFQLTAVQAYHKGIKPGEDCLGFIISDNENNKLIGFTGDTVWTSDINERFIGCPVICANMGGIIDVKKKHSFEITLDDSKQIKEMMYKENHLYLPGTVLFLDELKKTGSGKMVIIGELGEELKGRMRENLFHAFNSFVQEENPSLQILVEDIGLTIELNEISPRICCSRCQKVIRGRPHLRCCVDERNSEQLDYFCEGCLKALENMETGKEDHWKIRYPDPSCS